MGKNSKRILMIFISLTLIFSSLSISVFAVSSINQNGVNLSNYSYSSGYLRLEGTSNVDIIKVLITKNGVQHWYDTIMSNGYFSKSIFLNSGNGAYDAYIMVHTGSYNFAYGPHIKVDVNGENGNFEGNNDVPVVNNAPAAKESNFINISSNINNKSYSTNNMNSYNNNTSNSSNVIAASVQVHTTNLENRSYSSIALAITQNSNGDYAKAQSIYQWVSKNIRYDRNKYRNQLNNNYSDEYGAIVALRTGKGVCYDYSALASELGRAVGLQIRMAKGDYFLSDGSALYHAWNEVYIREQGRWISMDTTYASVYQRNYFDTAEFGKSYNKTEEE